MPNISEFRSFILSQNPNITKTELAQLDDFIERQQALDAVKSGTLEVNQLPENIKVGVASELGPDYTPPVSGKEKQTADSVGGLIDELKSLYNQPTSDDVRPNPNVKSDLSAGSSGILGPLGGALLGIKSAMNWSPDAKTYNRMKKGFTASLKQATGDTGVMTDPDYARIANILPGFGDSDETARAAWASIDRILAKKGIKTNFSYSQGSSANTDGFVED